VRDIAWQAPPNLLDRFAAAAESFRIPYWDWAIDKSLPDFVLSSIIKVSGPNGQNQTVTNPLYQYDFHPVMPGDFDGQVYTTQSLTCTTLIPHYSGLQ
jgi:tyrosinase